MLGKYTGYSYCSASTFIEHNEKSLRQERSWDSWKVEVKDGDRICFLDDDFNMPIPLKTAGSPRYIHTFKAELNGEIVQIPAWRLFDSYQQEKFVFPNEYDALSQAKMFLGQAWNVKCKWVKYDFLRLCLLILSPAEEHVRAAWEKQKMYIQRDIEINAYKEQIYEAYDKAIRANTKVETMKIGKTTEFLGTSSRFTWGEGYQEFDNYKDTVEYLEREYFKGLLLKETRYTKEEHYHE